MTPEAQRIAIAGACGWEVSPTWPQTPMHAVYRKGDELRITKELPDYLSDLNAMHEAEKVLTSHNYAAYQMALSAAVDEVGKDGDIWHYVLCATASQRAEAFLHVIGLWDTP